MAFKPAYLGYFALDNAAGSIVNLSPYIDNVSSPQSVDQLNVSVLSDGTTLEDPHELTDAMTRAFVEIRSAAGLSAELTVVANVMAP